MNPRVKSVTCIDNYKLRITFKNNEIKIFDISPYLDFPVYKELQNEALFKKAHVVNDTVTWNGEIDFDPDTLYLESKLTQ